MKIGQYNLVLHQPIFSRKKNIVIAVTDTYKIVLNDELGIVTLHSNQH